MTSWLKEIKNSGYGIRNGELSIKMSSSRSGKSVMVDYESKGIEPKFKPGYMLGFNDNHWCHNSHTNRWTFHKGRPFYEYIAGSDQIIARRDDGTFYWSKNRTTGSNQDISEEELKSLLFVILGAEEVVKKNAEWVDISKFRAKGTGIRSTIP